MKSTKNPGNESALSWQSYGISDVGKARKLNEDSLLELPEAGIWVVADGVGGHSAGDVASQMITENLRKIRSGLSLDHYIDNIEDQLLEINEKLLEKSRKSTKRTIIGSTVIVFLAYRHYCTYIWVGDSRLYRLRGDDLRQMTVDHSQVELYVSQGLISREEAASHPHSNVITRAVGATDELFLDMDIQTMRSNDRYLLCSDGLIRHLTDHEIKNILQGGGDIEGACKKLIDLALDRGAKDNVTTIVVDIKQASSI